MLKKILRIFLGICFIFLNVNTLVSSPSSQTLNEPTLYLTGSATPVGWDCVSPEKMTLQDGVYVWEGYLKANGEFKILTTLGNWFKCYNASGGNTTLNHKLNYNLVYNANGANDYKFIINKSGNYIIKIDLNTKNLYIKEKDKIRVLCVGNSITEGYGLTNKYPETLGSYLGDKYNVYNLGKGGRTMLKQGDYPYWNESFYKDIKDSEPDIIILKLGTNDSKPVNWGKYHDNFKNDMVSMVDEFSKLPTQPKIYLGIPCYVKPTVLEESTLESTSGTNIRGTVIRDYIVPIVREVAKEKNLETFDFYDLTNGWTNLYSDGVHPTNQGAILMAQYAYKVMTKQPVIALPQKVNFESAAKGVNNEYVINLKGNNLTTDLQVSVSGKGFSISHDTISKSSVEDLNGFNLTITCSPSSTDNANLSGVITITGGGLSEDNKINLTATPRDLYLIGTATPYQWDIYNAGLMTVEGNYLTWSGILKPGTLKFLTSKSTWFNNYYSLTANANITADGTTPNPIRFVLDSDYSSPLNYNLLVIQELGFYRIKVDLKNNAVYFTKEQVDDVWATGTALDNDVVKLDIDPNSSSTVPSFKYTGDLKAGTLKFMTTETIDDETKYIVPTTSNASIQSNSGLELSTTDLGWTVATASQGYKLVVSLEKLQAQIVAPKSALFLFGDPTVGQWNLTKALEFKKDASNPYIFSLECDLKINGSPGNKLKIMGQRAWAGFSLHPTVNYTLFDGMTNYKQMVAPANPDSWWNLDATKQGRYRIVVNTLNETVEATYLDANLSTLSTRSLIVDSGDDISVYGADQSIHVSLPANIDQATSNLFTLDGRLLDSSNETGSFTLGRGLSKGVYLVNIKHGTNSFMKKISVK